MSCVADANAIASGERRDDPRRVRVLADARERERQQQQRAPGRSPPSRAARPRKRRYVAVHERRPEHLEAPRRLREAEEPDQLGCRRRPIGASPGSRATTTPSGSPDEKESSETDAVRHDVIASRNPCRRSTATADDGSRRLGAVKKIAAAIRRVVRPRDADSACAVLPSPTAARWQCAAAAAAPSRSGRSAGRRTAHGRRPASRSGRAREHPLADDASTRARQYTASGSLLVHYGSPVVTQANTVIVPGEAPDDGRLPARRARRRRRAEALALPVELPRCRRTTGFRASGRLISPNGTLWMPAAAACSCGAGTSTCAAARAQGVRRVLRLRLLPARPADVHREHGLRQHAAHGRSRRRRLLRLPGDGRQRAVAPERHRAASPTTAPARGSPRRRPPAILR